MPGQKFGNEALGAAVIRQFAAEGNFTGTIVSFRKMGSSKIYTVQYADGDVEDVDGDEYNEAYKLWLRESGSLPDAVVDVRDRIEPMIDLTAASAIAGKHIGSMEDSARCAVIDMAQKNHRKLENKNVKAAVLEAQFPALCRAAFVKHLQAKVTPTKAMLHSRRPTLMENQATLAKLKIGDWVFATEDRSPGMNSEAGYGTISALHLKEQVGDAEPTVGSIDIRWLLANRYERHVKVERLTVVLSSFSNLYILYHLNIVP